MRSVDALGGAAVDALGGVAIDALGGVAIDALGRTAGTGGGKVEELAVEIGVGCAQASSSETGEGCGLQVPQASSSESSIAMVGATARADEAAWDTALGGVTGC